jgi:hypothetical protein
MPGNEIFPVLKSIVVREDLAAASAAADGLVSRWRGVDPLTGAARLRQRASIGT